MAEEGGEPGRRARVLVVDDSVDAAEMLGMLLDAWGHEVRIAYDGAGALAVLEAWHAELALLDIGMPGMDGYELAREIRQRLGAEAPRLVALTGYGQPEDVRRARESGFDEHLVKPPDLQRLLEIVQGVAGASDVP